MLYFRIAYLRGLQPVLVQSTEIIVIPVFGSSVRIDPYLGFMWRVAPLLHAWRLHRLVTYQHCPYAMIVYFRWNVKGLSS